MSTALLIVATIGSLAHSMVVLHPYQSVYFNLLAGPGPEERYDFEYWGSSFRAGFERILAEDGRQRIAVAVQGEAGKLNLSILAAGERERLVLVKDRDRADYYLTNYRQVADRAAYEERELAGWARVGQIQAGERVVLGIYRSHRGGDAEPRR